MMREIRRAEPTHLTTSNGDGLASTVREVHCIGDWDEPSTYFVFVRRVEDSNAKSNLVFRYRGGWEGNGWGRPATLAWRDSDSLVVTVDGRIEQITAQRSEVSGVHIKYITPTPECPSTLNRWQRLLWKWAMWFIWC